MLAFDQLLAGANASTVRRRELISEGEWVVDKREQEHEVEMLRVGNAIDRDGHRLADDCAERRRLRNVTGLCRRGTRQQFGPIKRVSATWDSDRPDNPRFAR